MTPEKLFIVFGSGLAGLSVALGAFASHGLKNKLTESAINIFETGAKYQMYHALGLLFIALYLNYLSNSYLITAGYSFLAGIILFSGSLYALSLTGVKILGAITPLGGVAFLVGWLCVILGVVKTTP